MRTFLEKNELVQVVALIRDERRHLSALVRLAYDKETLAGWRAIRAIGMAAREMLATDLDALRETCRKLIWSLSDESGGIGWSAPEILGEIVSADPKRFKDFIPLIASVYEIEEDVFRGGVLYALGRIAGPAPELAAPYQKIVIASLSDRDPLVKVRGLELVGLLWSYGKRSSVWGREYGERIITAVQNLRIDKGEAWIYRGDNFTSVSVGEEAHSCLNKLI
ncbi:MAG: DVU0298 family protein [Nitrospirota bacterium]